MAAEITLEFIARQIDRVLSEQAAMRDDMMVLSARMDRVEAAVKVVALEVHAFANQVGRLSERVRQVEEQS